MEDSPDQTVHGGDRDVLRDLAADLRLILDTAADGLYCIDRDGAATVCNAAFIRMLGFQSDEDVIGKKLHAVIHHSHPDGSRYDVADCPIYRTARVGGSAHVTTDHFYRQDGTSFPVEYWVRPILRGGVPQGAVCSFIDITERQQAEAELKRLNETLERRVEERTTQLLASEALIGTFFQHSSECHAVLVEAGDARFRYEEVNPATLQLYKLTREQVIGYTVEEVLGAEQAVGINAFLSACLRADAPYRYERAQGTSVVEAVATPVPDEPGVGRRVVVSARDVTEQRRLEERVRQAQKMEAVGQLTGGIAHDFNNLLTVVWGGLEQIRRHIAEFPASPAVTHIERARNMAFQGAQRAAALTSRLLAFSRQQALVPQILDANKLVTDTSEFLRRTLGETIALEAVLSGGLWHTFADPNQLENALINLAVNARDAMPDGGKLTIETANCSLDEAYTSALSEPVEPGQYVRITVTDTGAGMDAATRERAFDPFFTTKEMGKGTGLGLSQVYGFVRQTGGHVKIYSEVGEGTAVKIYLRRHVGGAAEVAQKPAGEVAHAIGVETILVVEDDDALRSYAIEALSELGYAVLAASDGASALRILEGNRVDLLFTDVVIPGGMNGRRLADEALRRRPGLKVLFTTGYTRDAIVHHGRLDAGVDLIGKPFSFEALSEKIRAVLDRAGS